jgi:hypothetical protein
MMELIQSSFLVKAWTIERRMVRVLNGYQTSQEIDPAYSPSSLLCVSIFVRIEVVALHQQSQSRWVELRLDCE